MSDPVAAGFRGAARRLQPAELAAEAKARGLELAGMEAVLDVESSGSGYDSAGRPKILTEPHRFYAELGAGWKRDEAVRSGLAYPRQGMQPYPATSDANYARLARWCLIDVTAALRSCSWGCAQVMGSNAKDLGFATVQDLVTAAMDSELAQVRLLVGYVVRNGLAPALRAHDWRAFARGYNGPGAVDAYAAKLDAAYDRHAGWSTPAPAKAPAGVALRHAPSTADTLNDAQWLRIRGGQG